MGGRSDDPKVQPAKKLLIASRLPRIWVLSVVVCGAVAAFCFALPLKSNKKEVWSAGPLTPHHRFLGTDCQSCHEKPFERVADASCMQCHKVADHPTFHNAALNQSQSCASCHHEHHGEDKLTLREDALCTSCHASLSRKEKDTKLKDVPSFERHPEFAKRSDPGSLKLNHRVHLAEKIRGPNGDEKLECADCHHPQQDGKLFEKVSYARDCARCHPLDFDETVPVGRAPHAPAYEVVEYLFGEFAKQEQRVALVAPSPGTTQPSAERIKLPENDPFDLTQQIAGRMATSPALDKTRRSEEILFTKTGCVLCHVVNEKGTQSEGGNEGRFVSPRYEIKKPEVPHQWLTNAQFDHAAHTHLTCQSCHDAATTSEKTADVLIPPLKGCQECHGNLRDEKGRGGLQSSCITCHGYHTGESDGKKAEAR